jgi:hypothetical protein
MQRMRSRIYDFSQNSDPRPIPLYYVIDSLLESLNVSFSLAFEEGTSLIVVYFC